MARRPRERSGEGAGAADVYLDDRKVGVLRRASGPSGLVTFSYDNAVLEDATAAVSVRMPVRTAPYEEHDALPCFENLLPDGDLRDLLASDVHHDPADVVGLLGVFAGECAGALSLWPSGTTPPATPIYRPCRAEDVRAAFEPASLARFEDLDAPADDGSAPLAMIAARLADPTTFGKPDSDTGTPTSKVDDVGGMIGADLAALLRSARLSMSGSQEKLVLHRRPPVDDDPPAGTPEYRFPVAGAPSTVLVKRERGRFPGLVQNEIATMEMMAAVGVPTASHTVCALDARVYETARFDRAVVADGPVRRLHAEDGCQLTGRRSHAKYAQTGGPTYAELRTVLRRYSADPLTDTERLFRWAVANLALGNRDAHAKNISLLYHAPAVRRLAPVYDVVCTMAYRSLDAVLPISFGGQHTLQGLTPAVLNKAAREFGLTAALARELVADVCDRIARARPQALHLAQTRSSAHPVLDSVDAVVQTLTVRTRRALLGD